MAQLPIALFALAYSGVVLFALAHAFRRLYPPMRAAWTAFVLSAVVHGATAFLADPERWLPLTLFWLGPHLLVLPLLIWAAYRQQRQP
jgi:ABC-type Na+ efflux pump permease subunit